MDIEDAPETHEDKAAEAFWCDLTEYLLHAREDVAKPLRRALLQHHDFYGDLIGIRGDEAVFFVRPPSREDRLNGFTIARSVPLQPPPLHASPFPTLFRVDLIARDADHEDCDGS